MHDGPCRSGRRCRSGPRKHEDAVPQGDAPAVLAAWGELVRGTLEAVERMGKPRRDNLERLVVVVPADLAGRHGCPFLAPRRAPPRRRVTPLRRDHQPASAASLAPLDLSPIVV